MIKLVKKTNSKLLLTSLISLMLILILVSNLISVLSPFVHPLTKKSNYAHFTYSEYEVGEWINKNIPKNTLIISDTYTDAMLSGLSNREKIPLLLRSHYFPEKYPQKTKILSILKTYNSSQSYEAVKNISEDIEFTCERYYLERESCIKENLEVIIVFNKKTFGWIGENSVEKSLNKFYNNLYYTVLYEDHENSIYIFGVNPEPGISFLNNNPKFIKGVE